MLSVQESVNILTMYFYKNNTLRFIELYKLIPEQFQKKEERDACISSLIAALSFSDFSNLVQSAYVVPNDLETLHFILKRPLSLEKQTVQIGGVTATHISQIINGFIDEKAGYSNPLNITEIDIQHLINIIQFLSSDDSDQKQKSN